eukprot:5227397-Prymnesium_polylepis.1
MSGACSSHVSRVGVSRWVTAVPWVWTVVAARWRRRVAPHNYTLSSTAWPTTRSGGSRDGTCKPMSHRLELEKSFQEWCTTHTQLHKTGM